MDNSSILKDIVTAINNETEREDIERGVRYSSGYEAYSILQAALERKDAASKDLKDALKSLWEGVKTEDETTASAMLGEVARTAREAAMAWVRVAAIAEKGARSV